MLGVGVAAVGPSVAAGASLTKTIEPCSELASPVRLPSVEMSVAGPSVAPFPMMFVVPQRLSFQTGPS